MNWIKVHSFFYSSSSSLYDDDDDDDVIYRFKNDKELGTVASFGKS